MIVDDKMLSVKSHCSVVHRTSRQCLSGNISYTGSRHCDSDGRWGVWMGVIDPQQWRPVHSWLPFWQWHFSRALTRRSVDRGHSLVNTQTHRLFTRAVNVQVTWQVVKI